MSVVALNKQYTPAFNAPYHFLFEALLGDIIVKDDDGTAS